MLLFLDTETSGLVKHGLPMNHPSQPDLVQLSCMLCDDNGGTRGTLDLIIRPDEREIPPESSEIHGITTELAMRYGVPRLAALAAFNALAGSAEKMIGYNCGFDLFVINRAFMLHDRQSRAPSELVDVMMMAKDELKLPPNFAGGDYKWPKLGEAYEHVTGKTLEGAHDSLNDVRATMDLYYTLLERGHREQQPPRSPRTSSIGGWGDESRNYRRLREVLQRAIDRYDKLSAWERSFVEDLDRRSQEQGEQLKMSDRQWQIIERIEKAAHDDPTQPGTGDHRAAGNG